MFHLFTRHKNSLLEWDVLESLYGGQLTLIHSVEVDVDFNFALLYTKVSSYKKKVGFKVQSTLGARQSGRLWEK